MILRFVVALIVLVSVGIQAGCGEGCDDVGCQPYVSVDFGTAFEEPGAYRVTIVADGEPTVCMLTLPRSEEEDCDNEAASTTGRGETTSTSQGSARNLSGVTVQGEPESIEITVEHEDNEVLSDTVTPEYRDEEINGEGCGTCRQGSALIELD